MPIGALIRTDSRTGPHDCSSEAESDSLRVRLDHEKAEMADHELTPITRKDGSQSLPARGYSWEPFLPDHVKSIIHGAESERVIEAVARIVRSEVVEQANWLLEPIFGDALARYCRAEARPPNS